jgi:DNA-binding transcriptional MerR regulator
VSQCPGRVWDNNKKIQKLKSIRLVSDGYKLNMAASLRLQALTVVKENLLLARLWQSPVVHSVRFRKPRWVPIAKSKEFYVRKPTPIIPEEYSELKHRYRIYRAEVESIRKFLSETFSNKDVGLRKLQMVLDTADLDAMKEQVQDWNKTVSLMRNERQAQEELEQEQRLHLLMQKHAEDLKSRKAEAMAELLKSKTACVDFIGPDQLDEAIEKLLDSHSDYNYAISKSGDILFGEYPSRPDSSSPATK